MWARRNPYQAAIISVVVVLAAASHLTIEEQKYIDEIIKSENKTQIEKTAITHLSKINYIKQSISSTTGEPFQTVEIEASGLPFVECVWSQVTILDQTQPSINMCDGWNGSKVVSTIPYAEFTAEEIDIKILIVAHDNVLPLIDSSNIIFRTSRINASVTVVGAKNSNNEASHLRVNAESLSQGVVVGTHPLCKGICYYKYNKDDGDKALKKPIQQTVKANASGDIYDLIQMDDILIPFSELSGVNLTLSEDGLLEVRFVEATAQNIETVVYDQAKTIISEPPYTCKNSLETSTDYVCKHRFTSKGLERYWVLIVALDREGYVNGSTWKEVKNPIVPGSKGVEDWAIVVSVFATVFSSAFIIWAVLVVLKKRNVKKEERLLNNPRKINGSSETIGISNSQIIAAGIQQPVQPATSHNQDYQQSFYPDHHHHHQMEDPIYFLPVAGHHMNLSEPIYDEWDSRPLGNTQSLIPTGFHETNIPTSLYGADAQGHHVMSNIQRSNCNYDKRIRPNRQAHMPRLAGNRMIMTRR